MSGISRLFGFGLFADYGEKSRPTLKDDGIVKRLPFECPECLGIKWHHTRTLECCGTVEEPHGVTEMEAIDPTGPGKPPETPGLRTGGECTSE